MAKVRKTNSGVFALGSLLETISVIAKVELKDNPAELAKVDKMVSNMKDSNIITAMKLLDDTIEAMHEAEERQERAAEGDEEQDMTEREIEEMGLLETETAVKIDRKIEKTIID